MILTYIIIYAHTENKLNGKIIGKKINEVNKKTITNFFIQMIDLCLQPKMKREKIWVCSEISISICGLAIKSFLSCTMYFY